MIYENVFRFLKGFLVFLFTPHPVNFFDRFMLEGRGGMYGIYTNLDVYLIIFGSIFNYLFIVPLLIKFLFNIRSSDASSLITVFYILIAYSILQLGITDPRIKYTFIFFLLAAIKNSSLQIVSRVEYMKYFFASVAVFFFVMLGRG